MSHDNLPPREDDDRKIPKYDLELVEGTVVKISGHPIRLNQGLFIKKISDDEFDMICKEVLDEDYCGW